MAGDTITFHRYSQEQALSVFPSILQSHLPHSNPIINRIQSLQNLPSRHCLFASTFPPDSLPGEGEQYTVLFADRSRHLESQIWVFNPVITKATLSEAENVVLSKHLRALIYFLKDTQIPEAPGWPFSPTLRFACVHEYIADAFARICEGNDAMPYVSTWNLWNISTSTVRTARKLPEGLKVSRVPEDQLDLVISTSSIPRQASTLLIQPSVGLLDETGAMVAWGYIGIDSSFATLYVLPEYRGKGLATYVAVELLGRLGRGEFADLGFDGKSGWAHSDVYAGNEGSEGVMRALGGSIGWKSKYLRIESNKF